MKLNIELDITNDKTWAEMCQGSLKTIIHHHLRNLKEDLKDYCDAELEQHWFSDNTCDCSKCVYNIHNENDFMEHMKDKEALHGDCVYTYIKEKDVQDALIFKICKYFCPAKQFRNEMTWESIQKLEKELSEKHSKEDSK